MSSRFLSTLSLRRATALRQLQSALCRNFYPRSPCGERRQQPAGTTRTTYFYPRSPCGERLTEAQSLAVTTVISIHALLAESDEPATGRNNKNNIFLSTLSLRRATSQQPAGTTRTTYFYPRSPCGERQMKLNRTASRFTFLSTLSLRRATSAPSITPAASRNFYPRSPCGERPHKKKINPASQTFLSTLSLRRATSSQSSAKSTPEISIHALLAESDGLRQPPHWKSWLFLSTLSLRRATYVTLIQNSPRSFLSTLSLRRATCFSRFHGYGHSYFYPRSPCGERLLQS